MKLIATLPVRNEAWVLGLSARVALLWCDELCVLTHASTDATGDILGDLQYEFPGRVHVVSFPEGPWSEMMHRETLLEMARLHKATNIAIVDADEIMTGNLIPLVTDLADEHLSSWWRYEILQLPGYNMRGSIDCFHVNGIWGRRWFSVAFRDDQRLHWANSARHGDGEQHHRREPYGVPLEGYRPVSQGNGGIMHLWGASERRLVAHHAWYKMQEAVKWPEKARTQIDCEYSLAIKGRPPYDMPENWQYQKAPESWWAPYAHLMQYLDLNAVPWQEAECKRLIDRYGREPFVGLDLFGVV